MSKESEGELMFLQLSTHILNIIFFFIDLDLLRIEPYSDWSNISFNMTIKTLSLPVQHIIVSTDFSELCLNKVRRSTITVIVC